jgi:hypothetical protein
MVADRELTRELSHVAHDDRSSMAPFYHRAFAVLWGRHRDICLSVSSFVAKREGNFSNGVRRRDGTASLDAPRSQVPAFPRQD